MSIKILLLPAIALLMLAGVACKQDYDAEPTYAQPAAAQVWAKGTSFYSPKAEIYLEATATWRSFVAFSFTYPTEPNVLGFANPNVPGKGTNALYMQTLYTAQTLSTDSGFYNITIPRAFELRPESEGAKKGTVLVYPQTVKIFRRDRTSFDIPIKGGGSYDETSGLMEVEVEFDETSIAGLASVKRKYRFRP